MKYWITGLLILAVFLIGIVYVLIPGKMTITATINIHTNENAAFRLLSNGEQWQRWWPGKQDIASSSLVYNGADYIVGQKMFQSLAVKIRQNGQSYNSQLILIPLRSDSLAMEWKAEAETGRAPLQRYRNYRRGRELEHDLHQLLSTLKPFLEKTENLYGFPITENKVKDSIILMATVNSVRTPAVADVYTVIHRLEALAAKAGARTTNHPMLNIDSSARSVITKIGLPIDREIDVTGTSYQIKRMVLGNILISEVKGGPYTSKNASKQVELYMNDHKRKSPAIPYESLVVDRSAEPDTAKWVTRIYYPVY